MNIDKVIKEIEGLNAAIKILKNEPMKNHTSFKIGGPADVFVYAKGVDGLVDIVNLCREKNIDFIVIGNGSNLLVSDEGIRKVVIKTVDGLNEIRLIDDFIVQADSGVSLSKTALFAKDNSLSGIEFLYGIPGSIGGAVYMNAGAYGGEISNCIIETEYVDLNGEIMTITNEEHKFGYRHSVFMENGGIILRTRMRLISGDSSMIRSRMEEMLCSRKAKQPLEYPSAGSVFKRCGNFYTGKLIEDCGLKGYRIGDAMVSDKHAGFIVNLGNATCSDVLKLIDHIKTVIKKEYGIDLECEIRSIS